MSDVKVEEVTPAKQISHLVHVESIPGDSIQITEYGKHKFNNLFFSPSNNKLYQKIQSRIQAKHKKEHIETHSNKIDKN